MADDAILPKPTGPTYSGMGFKYVCCLCWKPIPGDGKVCPCTTVVNGPNDRSV